MKKIILAMCLFGTSRAAYAQNGQQPPVTFSAGTNVCDNTPWVLVFQDHFNGNRVNAPWLTFNSWAGMPGGDNEDWGESRCVTPYNAIYKDANIVVSNGTVKLPPGTRPRLCMDLNGATQRPPG